MERIDAVEFQAKRTQLPFEQAALTPTIPNEKRALIFQRLSAPLGCARSRFSEKPSDL